MTPTFTPFSALTGGLLIGLAAALHLLLSGRIAGISGLFHGLLHRGRQGWQLLFLLGLAAGAAAVHHLVPITPPMRDGLPVPALLAAGFLVGFGTRLGSGCTSGHGVCGIGRRSRRSILATLVFMLTAIVTVAAVRHGFGAV